MESYEWAQEFGVVFFVLVRMLNGYTHYSRGALSD